MELGWRQRPVEKRNLVHQTTICFASTGPKLPSPKHKLLRRPRREAAQVGNRYGNPVVIESCKARGLVIRNRDMLVVGNGKQTRGRTDLMGGAVGIDKICPERTRPSAQRVGRNPKVRPNLSGWVVLFNERSRNRNVKRIDPAFERQAIAQAHVKTG